MTASAYAGMEWVIVPETAKGSGTGHLVRSLELAACLSDVSFVVPETVSGHLIEAYPELKGYKLYPTVRAAGLASRHTSGSFLLWLVDKPSITKDETIHMLTYGMVIGIDVRGSGLPYVPYVIDLLPRLGRSRAKTGRTADNVLTGNQTNPVFNPQPSLLRSAPPRRERILISFGGEDPAGLLERLIRSRLFQTHLPLSEFQVLRGPLFRAKKVELPGAWGWIEPHRNLRNKLAEYDLVVTSFGLTAIEAQAAGCEVLLLNPRKYHEKLSRQSGFISLGIVRPSRKIFEKWLETPPRYSVGATSAHQMVGSKGLAAFFEHIKNPGHYRCPGCNAAGNPVVARFTERSFFSCGTCGLYYMQLTGEQNITYDETYFFSEYEKQYGKTYLDDFDNIKKMGKERISRILSVMHPSVTQPRLLDIGCAYGPFLSAAEDAGFAVTGSDISADAVNYVKNTLGFEALASDIRTMGPNTFGKRFDVVSMWYVIEHFPDLDRILTILNGLTQRGGILALSTPSGDGISRRKDAIRFFDKSPRDHYSIWSPRRAAKLLMFYGFRLRKVHITGHHPERFPPPFQSQALRRTVLWLSRLLKLGDTFELYAEKVKDLDT